MLAAFDNFPALLIWFPLIGGLVAFFIKDEHKVKSWALIASFLTMLLMCVSMVFSGNSYYQLNSVSYIWLPEMGSSFALMLDGMGRLLCLLTAIAFPLIFIATNNKKLDNANMFYGLMLLTQCGLMGVFLAMDALVFYFFWELALIPVYFLASKWGGEKRMQAAFKFFIYTFAGSLFLLIGILYVYLQMPEPSFSLVAFYKANLSLADQQWLFWLFFVAFAIKMPIFPFHTWQPDAYEQSSTPVTMVLSGIMVKMGVLALIRWLIPIFPDVIKQFSPIVIGLSVVGMLYASFIAIAQDDIKRLVAYSSIAHIGLMCAAIFALNQTGIQGVMIQMFNHGINIIGMWIVVFLVEKQTGIRKISQLSGLALQAPVLAIMFVVIAFANIALPLTNAFIGEFLMFRGLYEYNVWFAAAAGLSIILSAVYTLNLVKNVFYGVPNDITKTFKDINFSESIVLTVIVAIILITGIYPTPLLGMVESSTNLIFNQFVGK